jgi:hypothetical protein
MLPKAWFAQTVRGTRNSPTRLIAKETAMRILALPVCAMLMIISTPSFAQQTGRPQDGFYSGQTTGQSNGQASVDGRDNRKEGVPPSAGDASRQAAPVNRGAPNDAESMDAILRPGLQR